MRIGAVFERARDAGSAKEQTAKHLASTGNTAYRVAGLTIRPNEPGFLPFSVLNRLRREVLEALTANKGREVSETKMKVTPNTVPYPEKKVDFRANILNQYARRFYERHGASVTEGAFETLSDTVGKTGDDDTLLHPSPAGHVRETRRVGASGKGAVEDSATDIIPTVWSSTARSARCTSSGKVGAWRPIREERGGIHMKWVMFYETAADGLSKAMANYQAHRARLDEFHRRGLLLMAGPWADPSEGALGVFVSREGAEEFIREDPFVVNGVVSKWTLKEWNEVLV